MTMAELPLEAVNAIKITYAQVEDQGAGAFTLLLQWSVAGSGSPQDAYWVWILHDGKVLSKQKSTETELELELTGVERETYYSAVVSDREDAYDAKKCPLVPLLFYGYPALRGQYDGETLLCVWQAPEQRIRFSQAQVAGLLETFSASHLHGRMAVDRMDLTTEPFVCTLSPFLNEVSAGPTLATGQFFPEPVQITELALTATDDPLLTRLAIRCQHSYTAQTDVQGRMVLLDDAGHPLASSEPAAFSADDQGQKLQADFSADFDFDGCWVRVDLCGKDTVTVLPEKWKNWLPLARPLVRAAQAQPGKLQLTWDYPPMANAGFCLGFGTQTAQTGAVRTHGLSLEQPSELDTPVTLRAQFGADGAKGASATYIPFVPGYYPSTTTGNAPLLCAQQYAEQALCLPLPPNMFQKDLTQTLAVGPLSIEKQTPRVLRVDKAAALTAELTEQWLTSLEDAGLTVAGYYFLRRQLCRAAVMGQSGQLESLCGLRAGGRQAEVLPGMSLGVCPGIYQLQPDAAGADTEGFLQGAWSHYPVSLREEGGTFFLCMDAFQHAVLPGWKLETKSEDMPYLRLFGGAMDWEQTALDTGAELRTGFLRLCYPIRFLAADDLGTRYASDHALLLTGTTRQQLDKDAKALLDDPTLPVAAPYLQSSGRASWSLFQSITLNHTCMWSPVGETLGDLLARFHMESPSAAAQLGRLSMTRQTALGPMPMHLSWFDDAQARALPILGGDRLQVR